MKRALQQLVLGAVAAGVALLVGAPPIPICWLGLGPPPEPQTSQCVAAFVAGLSPLEGFEYEHKWLAIGFIGLGVFVAELGLVRLVSVFARRLSGAR